MGRWVIGEPPSGRGASQGCLRARQWGGWLCAGAMAAALGPLLPARAETPLAARAADPDGWWKGRVFVAADVRASGGLAGLAERAALVQAAGADALVIAPQTLDARGAVEDHAVLDPRAGSVADWGRFVDAAHRAGLAVVVGFEANAVSRTHPWFAAAEAGDRLAQDAFVWRTERPDDAERWTESARGGRWYYHAAGPDRPDLDLRHRLTRARVEQAAQGWIERGADGLLVSSVRRLYEDEGGDRDRPESVGWVRELARGLRATGALTAVDVDDASSPYLDPAVIGFDGARARALTEARVDEAVIERAERSAPPGTSMGVRADDARTAVRGLAVGDAVLLSEPLLADPEVRAALALRRTQAALRWGARTPLESRGSLWTFVRHDGAQRVVVAVHDGDAPLNATLDLRALGGDPVLAPVLGGVEALGRGSRPSVVLPARSVSVWRVESPAVPPVIGFGRSGALRGALDRGLVFSEARGLGFSRDVERSVRCPKARPKESPRCAVPLEQEARAPLRWHLDLPPGAYEVEVDVEGDARLLAEGVALAPVSRKKHLGGAVFVRDGRLTLEAVEPGGALVEVRVRAARVRAVEPQVEVRPDRVVLRASGPGVVEWRMNRSRAEPAESAPLVRSGSAWEATLGPWPQGAVNEVAWVIRGTDGTFVTAAGGGEATVSIR